MIGVIASSYVAASSAYVDTVLADAPLAYWRLGEPSGTVATDSSGNGRNGTYLNGAAPGGAALLPAYPNETSGVFDGVNDKVEVPSASWMDVSSVTAEVWVNYSSTTNDVYVGRDNGSGSSRSWMLHVGSDGTLYFSTWNVAGTVYRASIPPASLPAANVPHHIVGTYDGATIRLYVDGTEVASTAAAFTLGNPAGVPIRIGTNQTDFLSMAGRIGHVAVYNHALSAARIQARYTAATS